VEVGDILVGQGIVGRVDGPAEAGHRREPVGMAQGQVNRSVAAHRQAGDRPAGAVGDGAEAGVDRGQEIVDQGGLPRPLAARIVDIPAVAGGGVTMMNGSRPWATASALPSARLAQSSQS
jgi:hypothetical protein